MKINYNLSKIYQARIQSSLDSATHEQYIDGLLWYPEAHDTIQYKAVEHNITFKAYAAIVAVLSPGMIWEQNIFYADELISKLENGNIYDIKIPTYNYNNVRKAITIFYELSLELVSGRKVEAFYETLCNPDYPVAVIDTWIIRLLKNRNTDYMNKTEFTAAQHAFTVISGNNGITVSQCQAISWIVTRDKGLGVYND